MFEIFILQEKYLLKTDKKYSSNNFRRLKEKSEQRFLYDNNKRILVKDTDKAKEINKEIYYLEMLLNAYLKGIIKSQ